MTVGVSEMVAETLCDSKLQFGSLHGFETSTVDSCAQFGDGDLLLVRLYLRLFLLEADFHIFDTLYGFQFVVD